ncbi:hypothetical protein COOONC_25459 [Cooperia oncophora]
MHCTLKSIEIVFVPTILLMLCRNSVLNFGFLPHRTKTDTVIGAPIDVPKKLEPTDEEVE